MWPFDRHTELPGQQSRLAAVINMAMGKQDLFNRDSGLLGDRLKVIDIPARVHEGGPLGNRTDDQGAVLLKCGDRMNLEFHPLIIADGLASQLIGPAATLQ